MTKTIAGLLLVAAGLFGQTIINGGRTIQGPLQAPGLKSGTGTLYVCVDTAGALTSATACSGTALPVADPTFSPAAGSYTSTQSVTIATTTPGASIRYTVDGITTPSDTVGTVYGGPVSISAAETLQAVAYKSGLTNSGVVSAAYAIGAPTISITSTQIAVLPGEGENPVSTATAVTHTAGDRVLVFVTNHVGDCADVFTVTNDQTPSSDTFTKDPGGCYAVNGKEIVVYTATIGTTIASDNIHVASTNPYVDDFVVITVHGTGLNFDARAVGGNDGSSGTTTSGTVTTSGSHPDQIVFAALCADGGGTMTGPTGYTTVHGAWSVSVAYKIISAAFSGTLNFTDGPSSSTAMLVRSIY